MTKVGGLEKKKNKSSESKISREKKRRGSRRENKSKRDFRDSWEQKQNIKDSQVSLLCTFLFLPYYTTFFFYCCVWLAFVARRCESKSILIQTNL